MIVKLTEHVGVEPACIVSEGTLEVVVVAVIGHLLGCDTVGVIVVLCHCDV